jgi:phospholipid/cholesterol/gamma-HCH transport system permease protein
MAGNGSYNVKHWYPCVTEIDALEVMGVNALNYLVFPKIIAPLLYPFLIGIAKVSRNTRLDGRNGGFISVKNLSMERKWILFRFILLMLYKTLIFCYTFQTIPSFHGYYTSRVIEVGKGTSFFQDISFIITSLYINAMATRT